MTESVFLTISSPTPAWKFPVSVSIIDCEFDFSIVAEYIVLGFAYSLELSLYTMNNLYKDQ